MTRCGSCGSSRPRASSNLRTGVPAYRRTGVPRGRGFYLILEGTSIDAVRDRVDATLPFVVENVATLEYDEIYEI
jgi:hypothetical protein